MQAGPPPPMPLHAASVTPAASLAVSGPTAAAAAPAAPGRGAPGTEQPASPAFQPILLDNTTVSAATLVNVAAQANQGAGARVPAGGVLPSPPSPPLPAAEAPVTPPMSPPPVCTEVQPSPEYSCEEQAGFQKCQEAWMVAGDYCAATCGRCGDGAQPAEG